MSTEMNSCEWSRSYTRRCLITDVGMFARAVAFPFRLGLLFGAIAVSWKWIYIRGISIMIQSHVTEGSPEGTFKVLYVIRCVLEYKALFCSTSAITLVSITNTRVFRTALTALTEPRTVWRRTTYYTSHCTRTSWTFWWRICTIRTTRVLHTSQWLLLCWSRLHNAWLLWECCWCAWTS